MIIFLNDLTFYISGFPCFYNCHENGSVQSYKLTHSEAGMPSQTNVTHREPKVERGNTHLFYSHVQGADQCEAQVS